MTNEKADTVCAAPASDDPSTLGQCVNYLQITHKSSGLVEQVRQALLGRESDIITGLLPDGIARGNEWWALNPGREDRHFGSFSVCLTGARAGQYHDFSSGDGGDLFHLVRMVTGANFARACQYLARACNINVPDPHLTIPKPNPGRLLEWKRRAAGGELDGRGCTIADLAATKKIPVDFLTSLGLTDQSGWAANGRYSTFPHHVKIPYRNRMGMEVAFRRRSDVSARRGTSWNNSAQPSFYGLDRLTGAENYLFVVEGESDCWALWHAGIPAVGIPGAALINDNWLNHLPTGARLYVVQEPDAAGALLVERLMASPSAERVRVIRLSVKDPADLWVADPDIERFKAAMNTAMESATHIQAVVLNAEELTGEPETMGLVVRSHEVRMFERYAPRHELIKGLVPVDGVGAIVAMPGAGKSLVGAELSRCVASGSQFCGRDVIQGGVLYCCPDSPASTERRLLAIPEPACQQIYSIADLPPLPGSLPLLRATLDGMQDMRLVMIDTYDAAREHHSEGWAGQDGLVESIVGGLRSLATDYKVAVLIIHHATRADNGRARGSVVFDARCDFIAMVTAGLAGIALECRKNRDGETGHIGSWRIQPMDVNGRQVPTLIETPSLPMVVNDDAQRQRSVLTILLRGEKMPHRKLAKEAGVPNGSIARILTQLRAAGYVCDDSTRLTEAGQKAACFDPIADVPDADES